MDRRDRLRRVVILCTQFMRNLAYYREGWNHPVGWSRPPLALTASFTRTANSNFLDVCVLEWCKLFGDKIDAVRSDEHCWWRIVSDRRVFEGALLTRLAITALEFDAYRKTMRDYRDKFLAHLDSEQIMNLPHLENASASVRFYHEYLVQNEVNEGDLFGLIDSNAKLDLGYAECANEAAVAYTALTSAQV